MLTRSVKTFAAVLTIIASTLLATPLHARPVVALMTDFGLDNEAAGLCKGAIAAIDSDINIIDLSHNGDAYDIPLAASMLDRTETFPRGTVFVCVIDPGVGTDRRAIALATKAGYYFVGPDNGIFTTVADDQGVSSVIELDPLRVNPKWKRGTFDGRDLFSPAGAKIATNPAFFDTLGTPLDPASLIRVNIPKPAIETSGTRKLVKGRYTRTDEPYGNVWTNITAEIAEEADIKPGRPLTLTVNQQQIQLPFASTFASVPEGQPLAYLNSHGTVSFAINMGDFRKKYNLSPGDELTISPGNK